MCVGHEILSLAMMLWIINSCWEEKDSFLGVQSLERAPVEDHTPGIFVQHKVIFIG